MGQVRVVSVDGTMNGRIKGFVISIPLTYTSMTDVGSYNNRRNMAQEMMIKASLYNVLIGLTATP